MPSLKKLVSGAAVGILLLISFWSFHTAIYQPLLVAIQEALSRFGLTEYQVAFILLVVSSVILIVVLGKYPPWVSEE